MSYDYIKNSTLLNKLSVPVEYNENNEDTITNIHTYKGAYVSLTYTCNLHGICDYCYAYDQKNKDTMSLADFTTIIKYIKKISNTREISFVGGEPTLVRNLPEYFDICAEFGLNAVLYTNACCSPNMIQCILKKQNLSEISVHFIPDVFFACKNYEEYYKAFELINHYSGIKSIIFVIDEKWNVRYLDELFDIAKKYHYNLRWIFATPTSRLTQSLTLEQMREITHSSLQPFLLKCLKNNIKTVPDLTIPLCIFDEDFLIKYSKPLHLIKLCIPFVYFKPDMRMQYCTSLNDIVRSAPESETDIGEFIIRNRCMCNNLKKIPSFSECTDCLLWKNNICQGGCLTYKLFRGKK